MTHQFHDLPYDYNALEPHIDAMTMEIHHSKHHRTYFDKMTAAVANSEAAMMDIGRLLATVSSMGAAVRNNAGGYHNHNIFWHSLSPDGGGDPSGALAAEIGRAFARGADELREQMTDAGVGRFGSGFAWLIVQNRKLKVVSTPNQDNPLMDVVGDECRGAPILALDVWEHAYYLKYQNRRPDYIKAFWQVVDWQKTNQRFEEAMDS